MRCSAILAMTAPLAMAQMAPAPSPAPAPPAAAGPGNAPTPGVAGPPQEESVDGPVKNVDPMAKTVKVGWFLGLFSTTLLVDDNTQIAVNGTKASLQDIREGDRVKASYENRGGENVAMSIDVMPTTQK